MGESKAESVLLKGDHTRTKTVVTSKIGALAMFTQKCNNCLGCKTRLLPEDEKRSMVVCSHCLGRESELYQAEVLKMNELEERFNKLWTQCQRCQGSLTQEVICTSNDCPIFYMRKKAQKEATDQDKIIQKFGYYDW